MISHLSANGDKDIEVIQQKYCLASDTNFAVNAPFVMLNGTVAYSQFPLKVAADNTIHGCQGTVLHLPKSALIWLSEIRTTGIAIV